MRYEAHIKIRRADGTSETIALSDSDLVGDDALVNTDSRYYSSGGGRTLVGIERLGVFATATLLDEGDDAEIETVAIAANGESKGAYRVNRARRENGRLVTTLGCRFNERVWRNL